MKQHSNLFKCHRSLNKVIKIEGNSQKATLKLNNNKVEIIPISRENYKYLKRKNAFGEINHAIQEKK